MSTRIIIGDAREQLALLPAESVHCCVTSPPYFGLRDYGTASWDGGDPACDHSPEARGGRFGSPVSAKQARNTGSGTASRAECPCGARRIDAQLGLEATPDEYVAAMVRVFREVRRVLRSDGTLWLNLGDSYAGGGNGGGGSYAADRANWREVPTRSGQRAAVSGLKPKDLLGMPWMLAFALRADGWWLRQDIIWAKPNPMPESVTDRCTKAHEYLFLLSKSERYYFDAAAIAEPPSRAWWLETASQPGNPNRKDGGGRQASTESETRNKRSVWTVATSPFGEAHFATFPPALIEPCILAGCRKDGTVLDPFGGAGTTGLVADRLGRNAILIELNPAYAEMAKRRIEQDAGLFAEVAD